MAGTDRGSHIHSFHPEHLRFALTQVVTTLLSDSLPEGASALLLPGVAVQETQAIGTIKTLKALM